MYKEDIEVLEFARAHIEQYGWQRKELGSVAESTCTDGAIRVASAMLAYGNTNRVRTHVVEIGLGLRLPAESEEERESIIYEWNDKQWYETIYEYPTWWMQVLFGKKAIKKQRIYRSRGKGQVLQMFDRVIAELRRRDVRETVNGTTYMSMTEADIKAHNFGLKK